ncbi:hypothetical protein SAMN04515674_12037 [Pseudarcicella hirudinis]|uniref:Uncharacterized protein n=1 Tax=Pseudarcicella hirudinis TaxID=1079859 RepID=A0A1I5YNI8_9BACT|nr:hypothetical protein [Pseudarcicella hirudinis]SFQ45806.1 hypothetical protein SAMN04515674_12037 [Pseudarcicella hirudinis]
MKKTIASALILIVILTFAQCHLGTKPFKTYFWTSNQTGKTLYLFIDEVNKGVLPALSEAPVCDNDASKKKALFVSLEAGTYLIEVKDQSGNIKVSEKLETRLSNHDKTIGVSREGHQGESRSTTEDDCLILELFY